MAEIHDNIIELLKNNNIDYKSDDSKLAKGILHLIKIAKSKDIKDLIFTKEKMKKGCKCPACNQHIKMYRVRVNSNMAQSLIKLLHLSGADTSRYLHVGKDIGLKQSVGGAWAKLRYWGLIEEKIKDRSDTSKRTTGMWRITSKGVQFVNGLVTIEKYIRLYNNKFYGYEGNGISIQDALGSKFNYNELMSR